MTATSGRRCLEQFGRFSHAGSWARTFAGFLLMQGAWYSSRCALTWKLSATKCNRFLFQLAPSMRPTGGTGCGLSQDLLPTPRATEIVEHPAKQAQRLGDRTGTKLNNLSSGAAFGLLPTPTVMEDRRKPNGNPERDAKLLTNLNPYSIRTLYPTPLATDIPHPEKVRKLREAGVTLRSHALGKRSNMGMTDFLDYHGLIPTPTASDWRGGTAKERKDGKSRDSELKHLVARRIGHASQLNPLFVTEMMGFPWDWLVSPFLDGGGKPSNASETR